MVSFLKKRSDYLLIYKKGRQIRVANNFKIVAMKTDQPKLRVGITIPAAVGNAVVRNRIRRWIKDFFRKSAFAEKSQGDINLVFYAGKKDDWKNLDRKDFDQLMELGLERLIGKKSS